jgi:6-phosphofructokinase 2
LGGDSLALYLAGGPNGCLLAELLNRSGVKNRAIPIQGATREDFTVVDESSGGQFRFIMPGPEVSGSEWQRCLTELERADSKRQYIVASGSLPPGAPPDFYARVARIAKKGQCRLILDTSGEALSQAADVGVYLLKPNLRELGQLAGRELDNEQDQAEAALRLVRDGGCEVVVVSLGAAGVLVASCGGVQRFRSPTVPIRSKVGAGDSMVAGLVLALTREFPLREVILMGLAAGAAAVMQPGTGLCRRDDAERLFEQLHEQQP